MGVGVLPVWLSTTLNAEDQSRVRFMMCIPNYSVDFLVDFPSRHHCVWPLLMQMCGAAAGDNLIDSSERTATVNYIRIRHKC